MGFTGVRGGRVSFLRVGSVVRPIPQGAGRTGFSHAEMKWTVVVIYKFCLYHSLGCIQILVLKTMNIIK